MRITNTLPGEPIAAGLRDLGENEWKQFVCVAASNILDAAIKLATGQQHRMTAVPSVEKL
jgi:D-hexose-6-phosphate mutarotase